MKTSTYAVYTPDIDRIEVPQSHDQQVWEEFFKKLLTLDYTAPFHAVLAKYHVFTDVYFEMPPSVYSGLYYDLGIDMAADDLYQSEDAAISTGFFQKGVRMIAAAVIADAGHDRNLLTAAEQVFRDKRLWKMLSEELAEVLKSYLEEDEDEDFEVVPVSAPNMVSIEKPYESESEYKACSSKNTHVNISDLLHKAAAIEEQESKDKDCMTRWVKRFEDEMLIDPNAAGAILSYFLEAKVGHPCTIFCPLDYEPYREMGQSMAESKVVMEAAKCVGLLAAGTEHYVSAALSNDGCWDCMFSGVAYLVNDPTLRCFIPFKRRYLAEHMLRMNSAIEAGDIDWWDVYKCCRDKFGDEMRGY